MSLLSNSTTIDIAVNAESHGIVDLQDGVFRVLLGSDARDASLSILTGIENVGTIYLCGGVTGFLKLSDTLRNTHRSWPQESRFEVASTYDTTRYVQDLWSETGRFKPLRCQIALQNWACQAIRHQFGHGPVVAVHLKQTPNYQGADLISLANESVWMTFLIDVVHQFDIKFLLLGDDPVSENIRTLPNVSLARDIGADNFGKHLALLSVSAGFMGMMSSICNMALFSDIPYAIFKNPSHHRAEMLSEIGIDDHYSFATKFQRVIREHETSAGLYAEFVRMPFVKC